MIFITGAAGFIGSELSRQAAETLGPCLFFDKLTYAGLKENISPLLKDSPHSFVQGDICDRGHCLNLFKKHGISGIIHLAAESHVDNSIAGPTPFIQTNINGTFALLEAAREHLSSLGEAEKKHFRFLHVSTDEVFGELGDEGKFSETTAYSPNSPYSASKAASDHLVRAWNHTYGLNTVITNCSNNYGPRQFPEKLIPRMILNALEGKALPVYGKGLNIRDWIHVEDHAAGVLQAFKKGVSGETYCFGGNAERKNIDVVNSLCKILDEVKPRKSGSYTDLIEFVTDRAGHDFRYAIDSSKAEKDLGFERKYTQFEEGLKQTVEWYLKNSAWLKLAQEKRR